MKRIATLVAAACLLCASPILAQTVSVPLPPPGNVSVLQPPASPCTGANKALQWDGASWSCVTIAGGGGGGGGALEGLAHVRRVGGVYTAFRPDTTVICAGSPTHCVQELLDYARPLGMPTHLFCLGSYAPLSMTDQTISVSAAQNTSPIYNHGCEFLFYNQLTGKDGFKLDTLLWSAFVNVGGSIKYCGSGSGVLMQPKTNLGVVWSHQSYYELGFVYGMSDCPVVGTALVRVDLNQTCGTNQVGSSAFVNNHMSGFLRGSQKVQFNFKYDSPTCPYVAGGENFFYFWDSTDAYNSEYYIGVYTGGPLDQHLGTSWYTGNIAHTSSLPGGYGVISGSQLDVFWMTSVNIYNAGPSHSWYTPAPLGCKNIVRTTQTLFGSSGTFFNGNCAAPNANVVGAP